MLKEIYRVPVKKKMMKMTILVRWGNNKATLVTKKMKKAVMEMRIKEPQILLVKRRKVIMRKRCQLYHQ